MTSEALAPAPLLSDSTEASPPLMTVRNLTRYFPLKNKTLFGFGRNNVVHAVDGISFEVRQGETLAVVGESGCGKSTTARLLMRLIEPDSGEVLFQGKGVGTPALTLRQFRRQTQMVFQDSYSSLNPRMTIEDSIAFAPRVHGLPPPACLARARDLLARVGLDPTRFAGRYPHELSGGQRQRVNIARALALEPRLVILDEAVSALDKSVEAQVLNLLQDLKEELQLTYLFISHDLNVVRLMADRVMVMYLGEIIEIGEAEQIFNHAMHPYTQALLQSMPNADPELRTEAAPLSGDPPNPIDPPAACRFHQRCGSAKPVCTQLKPRLTEAPAASTNKSMKSHQVACLIYQPESGYGSQSDSQSAEVPHGV